MISLACTSCQQMLEIDDAFAGGVCRCQYCGAIQTVPAPGKPGVRGPVVKAKTLYRNEARGGSGMDALAQIATSSGLSSSGHVRQAGETMGGQRGQSPDAAPPGKNNLTILLSAAGGVILTLVIVIIVILSRSSSPPPPPPTPPGSGYGNTYGAPSTVPPTPSQSPTPSPVQPVETPLPDQPPGQPSFAGMPLDGLSVIYLLDNGSSAAADIGAIERVTLRSIHSLGRNHKFQVIFWGGDELIYPAASMAPAGKNDLAGCEAFFANAYTQPSTTINKAMQKAIGQSPAAIVIITAKGPELPARFVKTVLTLRGTNPIKIFTIGIDGDSPVHGKQLGALAQIAAKTGGQYMGLSTAELSHW